MNRRRSRFTATLSPRTSNEVVRKVILAYTADGVRDFYARQGYVVLEVRKGDYKREAAKRQVLRNAPGFTINHLAVKRAAAHLGIEWGVEIVTDSRVGSTGGNHSLIYSGGRCYHRDGRIFNLATATRVHHRIMVKTYHDAKTAGEIIWHELTHAAQSERAARDAGVDIPEDIHTAWAAVKAEYKGLYKNSPLEIEANRNMPYNDACPLAR